MGQERVENMNDKERLRTAIQDGLLEAAWGIIANAHGGDWDKATDEWHSSAKRWRDLYHEQIKSAPTENVEVGQ